MPAPTALLQPAAVPEAALVPVPEQEDELLVDMQDANTVDPTAIAPPTTAEETDMVVDEEGRPRFAPGKDIVGWVDKSRRRTSTDALLSVRRTPFAVPRQERSPSRQTACLH